MKDIIEFTTKIGCPVACMDYCPQDVLVRNYKSSERLLTMDNFKKILSTVPKDVVVSFCGFCEPFANKDTMKMIKYAHDNGYKISLSSTLSGATREDVQQLIKIPLELFMLHLPDGKHSNIPVTQEYMENVFTVMQKIPNIGFMSMNDNFTTCEREDVARGLAGKKPYIYRLVNNCPNRKRPAVIVLPNGDVQFCCVDYTLKYKIGNLLEEDWATVHARFYEKRNKFDICNYCSYAWLPANSVFYRLAKDFSSMAGKIGRKDVAKKR